MIIKKISESVLSVTAEGPDDLLGLRRVLRDGDGMTGSTTRVLKLDRDYSRPNKGERVRIRISITIEKISLDGTFGRLRVSGTISESSNDSVPHGSYHSITITAGDSVTITRGGKRAGGWSPIDLKILRGAASSGAGWNKGFVLVAMETGVCGIARLYGTHLAVSPNIYSGIGGKRYKTSHKTEEFFGHVRQGIDAVLKNGDEVLIMGPGNTKRGFANHIKPPHGRTCGSIRVIDDGVDSGGEDGIYMFTRSEAMQQAMAGSKLAEASRIMDEIMECAHKKSPRYTMGYEETLKAARQGSVDSLIFSDGAFKHDNEQEVVDLLNAAEAGGAKVYGVDSTTDIGLRATGLGGIVSLLRWAA